MSDSISDSANESETATLERQKLVDELLQSVDLDCSLSSSDINSTDLMLYNDEASPSTSSCDGGSMINFHDVLQGLNHFLYSAKDETVPANNTLQEKPQIDHKLPNGGDESLNIVSQLKKKRNHIKKGQRYMPNFKRKVLNYAVKHTFRETADKFNVNCNTLTEWAREYKRLLQLKKSTTTRPGSTLKTDVLSNLAKTDETDTLTQPLSQVSSGTKLIQWLRRKRLDGIRVRREEVQSTGLAFLQTGSDSLDWFGRWVRRLTERSVHSRAAKQDPKAECKRIFYPDSFKLEVALYAKEYTKQAAAKTFGVSSRRLYEWCERHDNIADSEMSGIANIAATKSRVETQLQLWFNKQCAAGARPKSHELICEARVLYSASGLSHVKCSHGWLEKIRKRLDLKLSHGDDDALLLWVLSQLDDNRSLSVLQVTSKAKQLAVKNQVSFKGSKGWTLRFLKRHSHVLQCSSARLTDLPAVAAAQARIFCRTIQQRVSAAGLTAESVGCMDEVAITFIFPTDKVQTPRLLRKAGLEAAHVVVFLAATSDGQLLPPTVVMKGPRAMQTFHSRSVSVPVLYIPDNGIDAQALRDWAQHIWLRFVRAPSVLIVDSFAPHKDPLLNEVLSSGCCHLAIIPAGCAVHLQPCAFNLSRRFQETIQEEWLKYAAGGNCPEWRSKANPDQEVVLNWVVNAFISLREDTYSIRSSFQLTGLTKATCNGLELITSPDLYISKTDTQV